MLGAIIKFFVIGLLAIAALGIAAALFGVAIAAVALLFKVAVIGLIGYGAYHVFRALTGKSRPKEISAEDRKWLES